MKQDIYFHFQLSSEYMIKLLQNLEKKQQIYITRIERGKQWLVNNYFPRKLYNNLYEIKNSEKYY